VKAAIVVIDGLGVGAMPDAGTLRAVDATADTLGNVVRCARLRESSGARVTLPNLAGLGLAALRPDLEMTAGQLPAEATARRSALGYPGADTFAGHQTLLGADMSHGVVARVSQYIDQLSDLLRSEGHDVTLLDGLPLLVIDGVALLHDNLEADPGINWNVSARLDEMPFDQLLDVGRLVRSIAPVARVIVVGGHSDRPLPASVRPGEDGTVGLDTPRSGFYRNGGLQVVHLGAHVEVARQLPSVAASAGMSVTLIGKATDIVETSAASPGTVVRLPGVETTQVLADITEAMHQDGLIVANVQQTDLAGHQQDCARYFDVLTAVDAAIPAWLDCMDVGDLLVVTGDHGNDPTIGHAFHTREYVPVLAAHKLQPLAATIPVSVQQDFATLADIGASVALHLGLDPTALAVGSAARL